jgi:ArsR family transcriptional regulator, arsenate/arsenite/antimonite-responsive transcriptional repressor
MRDTLEVFKALSDANRIRLLCAISRGELCVCQLIELLNLAPSTVSKHLSILRKAGLIDGRKDGRWVYYTLPARTKFPIIGKIMPQVFQSLEKTPDIRADGRKLKRIKEMDTEVLCRKILSRM